MPDDGVGRVGSVGGLGRVDRVLVLSIPMRTRFRGLRTREVVLVRGESGWAEFSPFWEYDDAEAASWWRCTLEASSGSWPAPVRESVEVNATVPAIAAGDVRGLLARFPGCATVKVKVAEPGQSPQDDLARLSAVRSVLGPAGQVRVDVNGRWDVDTAVALLPRYDRQAGGLEYAEQPCATVEELAAVRRRVEVPIAADESIRRADDPLRVARLEAADVAVLKVQPLGGVAACLRIAEEIALPVVVSSALETSVGMAAGLALAAALPQLPYACGLATVSLFQRDVCATPLVPLRGQLPVGRAIPDAGALVELAAPEEVRDRWLERLARVAALVG